MRIIGLLLLIMVIVAGCNTNAPSSIAFEDVPTEGDPVHGEQLFNTGTNPPCLACHNDESTGTPNLDGLGERAGGIVEAESAEEYIFYAITEPARHIAEGFGNAMPNTYDEDLNAQDIADLIAYLLSR